MLPHISMTYRDWQEKLLSAKGPIDCVSITKNKMKRPGTWVYAKRIKAEFEGYLKNKGIFATCLRYLDWLASEEGNKGIKALEEDVKTFGKTIIVPVAILGCGASFLSFSCRKFIVESDVRFLIGKTLFSIPIKHLFVFGTLRTTMWKGRNSHLISSRMWGSYWRNTMWSSMTSTCPLIILLLDYQSLTLWYPRNNHTRQHRDPLCKIAQKSNSSIRLLAWHWCTYQPPA